MSSRRDPVIDGLVKSGDPIDLSKFRKKRAEFVWECSCGSQHFYLHRDGTIECRSCKLIKESIEWVFRGQSSQLDKPSGPQGVA